MKHILILSLLLIVLLALAACGSNPAAPAASPTDPPTATAEPAATPRPTATAAPTEAACDLQRLVEAVDSVVLLDSYRQEATVYRQFANEQVRSRMLTQAAWVEMSEGQVSAIDMQLVSYTDAGMAFRIIMVDDQIYYKPEEEQWLLATELLSETLGVQISQSRAIDEALLELLEDQPCEPFSGSLNGRTGSGFRFSEFTTEDIAALPSAAGDLSQLPADMEQSGEYIIWLAEVDGLLLPVGMQLTLTFDVGDGDSIIEAVTELSGFNEPLNIVAPDVSEAPPFTIEVTRPDDAEVFLDGSTGLGFYTATPPEEMKSFYTNALTADGWVVDENRKETTAAGLNVDVTFFSRGDERLEMGIAVIGGDTMVAFTMTQ